MTVIHASISEVERYLRFATPSPFLPNAAEIGAVVWRDGRERTEGLVCRKLTC
jgi:hypothetical protein